MQPLPVLAVVSGLLEQLMLAGGRTCPHVEPWWHSSVIRFPRIGRTGLLIEMGRRSDPNHHSLPSEKGCSVGLVFERSGGGQAG